MVNIKITKIIKVGDSCGVIIPKNILQATELKRGDQVAFGIERQGTITIIKVSNLELK